MLHVWDFRRHGTQPIIAFKAHGSGIADLDVNPSETLLLTGDGAQLKVWPILSPAALKRYGVKP